MAILCIAMAAIPTMALQGGNITQYLNAYLSGTGNEKLMPDVVTLTDGTIAYAIEGDKVSTRKDTEYGVYEEANEALKTGLQIIMQYGYPLNMGPDGEPLDEDNGIAADKARYATAVAIQSWAIHNGAAAPQGWTDFVKNPTGLIAAEGCEDVVSFTRFLMEKAQGQVLMPHGVSSLNGDGTSLTEIKMKQGSTGYEAGFTVKLQNVDMGYSLDIQSLPEGVKAEGYTGEDGDRVRIILPSNCEDEYKIKLIAKDTRIVGNLIMYTPTTQSDASKLIGMAMTAPYESEEVSTQEITLSKTAGSDWTLPAAASPSNTPAPSQPVPDGAFKPVNGCVVIYDADTGKGVEGAGVTITDASGNQIKDAMTDANGCVSITDLPGGKYFCENTTAAEGYDTDPDSHKFAVIPTTTGNMYKGDTVMMCSSKYVTIFVKNKDNPLKDIDFNILDESGEIVSSTTTDEDGEGIFVDLDDGTYKIVFDGAPSDTPAEELEALKKLSKEIFITEDHDNNTAVYTFDIAELMGNKKAKTGEREVIIATRLCFVLSLMYLGGFFIYKIMKDDRV